MGNKRIDKTFYAHILLCILCVWAGVFAFTREWHIASCLILGIVGLTSGISAIIAALIKYRIPLNVITETHYGKVEKITYDGKVHLIFDKNTHPDGPFRRIYRQEEIGSWKIPKKGEIIRVKVIVQNLGKD